MRSLLRALGLFTVVPVRSAGELTRPAAVAALRWLPAVGGGLGALAALPMAAVLEWAPHAPLVGAVLAVGLLALLTRGLHLDGLADTVDGLGSRAPAEDALAIMRRSDIGPFGVAAIVLALLVDVAALASVRGGVWAPVAALAVAAATGRLAVLLGAHRRVRSARPVGFGAFVAGSVSTPVLAVQAGLVLGASAGVAAALDASVIGWVVAPVVAVLLCALVVTHVVRRLKGVTGDVFGAVVEIGTALTLAALAFT